MLRRVANASIAGEDLQLVLPRARGGQQATSISSRSFAQPSSVNKSPGSGGCTRISQKLIKMEYEEITYASDRPLLVGMRHH